MTDRRAGAGAQVILGWGIDSQFLLPTLLPRARLVEVPIGARVDLEPLLRFRRVWLQCNLSRSDQLPLNRRELVAACLRSGIDVVNAQCTRIDKRWLQRRLLSAGARTVRAPKKGALQELLFVKSNANYGGEMERTVPRALRKRFRLVEPSDKLRTAFAYRCMPRGEVPEGWWTDPALAIECYVQNEEGRFLRAYVVGGHVVLVSVAWDAERFIKKMRGGIQRVNYFVERGSWPSEVPADLETQLRAAIVVMQLDFGAIDAVVDSSGKCFVVDVNPTPFWGSERQPRMIAAMRRAARGGPA